MLVAAERRFPLSLPSIGIKRSWRHTAKTALGFRCQTHLLGLLPPAINALREPARGEPDTAQQSFTKPTSPRSE